MEQIRIDQFLDYKFLSGLSVNPGDSKLAYAVASAKLEKNEYHYDLYLTDGIKQTKLISMKKNGGFIWETDDTILFSYAKDKKEEKLQKEKNSIYYRYTISSKKLEKAYMFSFPVSIIEILNDGKLLLSGTLTDSDFKLYNANKEDRKKLLDEAKKQSSYEDISEIPFYFNGRGFTANQHNQLFIYDISNQSVSRLVNSTFNVEIIQVSKDKNLIFYTGQEMTGVRSLTSSVYCFDVAKNETQVVYDNNEYSISGLYLIDQVLLVTANDMKKYGLNQNDDFYLVKNNQLIFLQKFGQGFNSVGSDSKLGGGKTDVVIDHKLFFVATIDDHNVLMSIDLSGNLKQEYIYNGSLDMIEFLDGKLFTISLYKQKLQELYQINLKEQKQIQLTKFNQKVLSNRYVAVPKEFVVQFDSHTVKGWVLFPKDYDKTLKYPAILDIHGGPKTVYGKVFFHEMQYWANEGYIVFFANPRGSDGKGDEFADIRGKYGTIDYDDLMAFTDLIIKKVPSIDTTKLFVTGGSYGGFMTNWIVGHTNRFKAAVTQRSITNWLSFYGTSDIGFYFAKDQTGGHPNVNTDLLWNQSPLKYALSIKTPLLFIHSDQDYRCPIEQAMQLFTTIKENGVQTKLVWFKGETHELSRSGKPQARIKRLTEITNWFNQFLD